MEALKFQPGDKIMLREDRHPRAANRPRNKPGYHSHGQLVCVQKVDPRGNLFLATDRITLDRRDGTYNEHWLLTAYYRLVSRQSGKVERPKRKGPSTPPGFKRVFGLYPTRSGMTFGFLEIDNRTYRMARKLAVQSGLSVGEEVARIMEKNGLTINEQKGGN